jgi:S1/P1 Nuclease
VVDKINEFRLTLQDKTKTVEDRRFALRFLIHCIEDMHMPRHVGDSHDRGGNDTHVRFFDRGTNMHWLWDSDMIERASKSEEDWLKELTTPDDEKAQFELPKGTVEDWARESLPAAREAYEDPTTNKRIKPGARLGDAYQERSLPVVRQRLYRAGVRLAGVLNECFEAR